MRTISTVLLLAACVAALAGCPPVSISISTIEELQKIGNDAGYPLDGDYVLACDIDASDTATWNAGAGFVPIGSNAFPFTGAFDGQGFAVISLSIDRGSTEYVGLFGFSNGTISGVSVLDSSIAGSRYVGCVAGSNYGIVSECGSSGSVSAVVSSVGGIVGSNLGGTIEKSYSLCSVSCPSGSFAGGLAGAGGLGSVISDSYSTGVVSSPDRTGGLVGGNSTGSVTNCYSIGAVSGTTNVGGLLGASIGTVTASYWNTETSGQPTSADGTGKTTAEMKLEATFDGWDFDDVWAIGHRYPSLQGQSRYMLEYSSATGGALSGFVSQVVKSGHDGTAVTAVASARHHFVCWSDPVTDNPRTDLAVTENISVTAQFSEDSIPVIDDPGPPPWAYSIYQGANQLTAWRNGSWKASKNAPDVLSFAYPKGAPYSSALILPEVLTLKDQAGVALQTFRVKDPAGARAITRTDGELLLNVEAEDLLVLLSETVVDNYSPGPAVIATSITSTSTTFDLDSDTGYPHYATFTVLIDGERISCHETTAPTFAIDARGVDGTATADHIIGARVRLPLTLRAHASAIIALVGGLSGGTLDAADNTTPVFFEIAGVMASDAIAALYTLSGNVGHYYVRDGYFNWDTASGRTEHVTYGYNLRGFQKTCDKSQLCTRLWVYGAGLSPATRLRLPAPGYIEANTSTYGTIAKPPVVRDDISDLPTLIAFADALLPIVSVPRVNYAVSAIDMAAAGVTTAPLWKGDTVILTDSEAGFTTPLELVGFTRSLDSPLDVSYEIANGAIDLAKTLDAIMAEIKRAQNRDFSQAGGTGVTLADVQSGLETGALVAYYVPYTPPA